MKSTMRCETCNGFGYLDDDEETECPRCLGYGVIEIDEDNED